MGVTYKAPDNMPITTPDTSIIMLEDISDWSKVTKFPKPNDIDPERTYQEALKTVDRSVTCLKTGPDWGTLHVFGWIYGV